MLKRHCLCFYKAGEGSIQLSGKLTDGYTCCKRQLGCNATLTRAALLTAGQNELRTAHLADESM